jgi:hypothetical protein
MLKKGFLAILLSILFAFADPVPFLTWEVLENVDFQEKFVKEAGENMLFPKFPPHLTKWNNKPVTVEGYVIPVDKTGTVAALSANPYAACFFCGKAGPASVLTLKFKTKSPNYKTDDYVKFSGTLKLNDSDFKEFYYILENAVEVK